MRIDRALSRVEEAAWRVARESLGERIRARELEAAIVELSALYNARDAARASIAGLRDERMLAARLLFFTLADLPKAALALAELAARGGLAAGTPLSVLDVGAGCGAMALGLACLVGARAEDAGARVPSLQVTALDSDDAALALARRLAAESGLPIALEARHHDLARPLPRDDRRYQLGVAGTLLNELDPARRLPLLEELLARLAPGGALIVIEPATRAHSRALLGLRDRLLETTATAVVGPCTHRSPCPALVDPDDWCHECRVWTPPRELQALARRSGLRRRDLVYSYLTLCAGEDMLRPARPHGWRVVSAPLRSKGKHELFLCGERGRLRVSLLTRHKSERNASFLEAARGHVLWLEGELTELGPASARIGADTRVEVVEPAALALG